MSAMYTPGPWKVDDEGRTGDASDIWIATPGGGHSLARLGDDSQLSHDEHLANARLIAAAPELLAFVHEVARCGYTVNRDAVVQTTNEARALIARIEAGA